MQAMLTQQVPARRLDTPRRKRHGCVRDANGRRELGTRDMARATRCLSWGLVTARGIKWVCDKSSNGWVHGL